MGSITVIVPTIWAFEPFPDYIKTVAELDDIKEIIIVDNNHNKSPLIVHEKVRIIVQGENIFVNPAWNIGAKIASAEILCFLNDDIIVRSEVFPYVRNLFWSDRRNEIGLIGIDWDHPVGELEYKYVCDRDSGPLFGCLMFIRNDDYLPIPNSLKIWHGDHYLILLSLLRKKHVVAISGYSHELQHHSISTKNLSKEIDLVIRRDGMIWNTYISRWMRLRYRPYGTIKDFLTRRIRRQ